MINLIKNEVKKYESQMRDGLKYLWENAETGYREVKSSSYMAKVFEDLGYTLTYADGITGFITEIDTGRKGPTILVLSELDSLINFDHPDCVKETGAVHSCGHAAQCGAMIGIAGALKSPEILEKLSGKIRLCVVPAEELIEIEYRQNLIKKGVIKYLGGKAEFLSRGYFDGVDMAFMLHTTQNEHFFVNNGAIGCIAKKITYKGVSAHAGGSPWNGVNALYASTLGLSAINAIRETFKEQDIIRVHPIITKGGNAVNAIPDKVTLESYIRGNSFDAILDTNKKVNRALIGSALSIGCNIEIEDSPGYAPFKNDSIMREVFEKSVNELGYLFKSRDITSSGCTDMGDLACVMPIIHPYAPGAIGLSHGNDYYIDKPELAVIASAEVQVKMLVEFLSNGGKIAKEVIENYVPLFSSNKDYLNYLDSINSSGERIEYKENSATVKL